MPDWSTRAGKLGMAVKGPLHSVVITFAFREDAGRAAKVLRNLAQDTKWLIGVSHTPKQVMVTVYMKAANHQHATQQLRGLLKQTNLDIEEAQMVVESELDEAETAIRPADKDIVIGILRYGSVMGDEIRDLAAMIGVTPRRLLAVAKRYEDMRLAGGTIEYDPPSRYSQAQATPGVATSRHGLSQPEPARISVSRDAKQRAVWASVRKGLKKKAQANAPKLKGGKKKVRKKQESTDPAKVHALLEAVDTVGIDERYTIDSGKVSEHRFRLDFDSSDEARRARTLINTSITRAKPALSRTIEYDPKHTRLTVYIEAPNAKAAKRRLMQMLQATGVDEATIDEDLMVWDWPKLSVRFSLGSIDANRGLEAPIRKALKTLPYVTGVMFRTFKGSTVFTVDFDGTKFKRGWETNPHNFVLRTLHADLKKKGIDLTHPKDVQGGGFGSVQKRTPLSMPRPDMGGPLKPKRRGPRITQLPTTRRTRAVGEGLLTVRESQPVRDWKYRVYGTDAGPHGPSWIVEWHTTAKPRRGYVQSPERKHQKFFNSKAAADAWAAKQQKKADKKKKTNEATTSGSVGGFSISTLGQATPLPPVPPVPTKRKKKRGLVPASFIVGGQP